MPPDESRRKPSKRALADRIAVARRDGSGGTAWEIVQARCARRRREDIEEVEAMHQQFLQMRTMMKQFGGMVSFALHDDDLVKASAVVSALKVFTLAESLGGVESLAGHPATMTHASIPKAEREKTGVTDGLIRLSVGLEDVRDLTADLDQALSVLLK